jgi:hypothetical protein
MSGAGVAVSVDVGVSVGAAVAWEHPARKPSESMVPMRIGRRDFMICTSWRKSVFQPLPIMGRGKGEGSGCRAIHPLDRQTSGLPQTIPVREERGLAAG